MDISLLHEALKEEKKFRHTQANKAVFVDLIDNWSQASTFSADLRNRLNVDCPLDINVELQGGGLKNVTKALITFSDGAAVETVLIPQADGRFSVCLSSQVGCPLACVFCATGMEGFTRNLKSSEIIEQFIFWARYLKQHGDEKVDNVVFMGQGEPFLNYEEVIKAVKFLNNPETFNFGARRISISTAGVINGIKRLAGEKLQVNLAISLHAPSDALRINIMPAAGQTPLRKLLEAVDAYIAKTGRRVMFEYLLIKEVNDRDDDAIMLAKLLNKPLYLVNLIPYNPTGRFLPSTPQRIARFRDLLERNGLPVTARRSFGQEIDAACGQLAGKRKKS